MTQHSVKLMSLKTLPLMIPYGIRELIRGEVELELTPDLLVWVLDVQ